MKNRSFTSIVAITLLIGAHAQPAAAEVLTQVTALNLMKKSGCIACHAIDKMKLGPAYQDVAKRYAIPDEKTKTYLAAAKKAVPEYLFSRIRSGVKIPDKHWPEAKGMMTPNPVARISDSNLKSLVTFILSLK